MIRYCLAATALFLLFAINARAISPCCNITAINAQTGIVTAQVKATGQVFQFAVKNAATLKSLKVGQAFFANFTTKQASLDGRTASFPIVNLGPVDGAKGAVNPLGPIDGARIVSIEPTNGIVTARVTATGRTFQFKAAPSILNTLKPGQAVFANFTTQKVSVNGISPCCSITSSSVH